MLPPGSGFSTGRKIWWHDGAAPPGLPLDGSSFPGRSRQHLGPSRGAAFQIRNGKISSVQQGQLLYGGIHGYVDVLENFTGRDSLRAVGGFHQIVASLSAMFTSERIPELQGTGELPGSDQKSRAIDLPFALYFPHFVPPLGEGNLMEFGCQQKCGCLGWNFCEGENESTRDQRRGQSQSLVQFRNLKK